MKKPCIIVVAAALIDAQKKILFAERPQGKYMAGMWEFPGGKMEPGENPENALVRELYEELNIHVLPSDLTPLTFASHEYDDFHMIMPLYICKKWEGTLIGKEGQQFAFISLDEISSYPMPPADIPLINRIVDFLSIIL